MPNSQTWCFLWFIYVEPTSDLKPTPWAINMQLGLEIYIQCTMRFGDEAKAIVFSSFLTKNKSKG